MNIEVITDAAVPKTKVSRWKEKARWALWTEGREREPDSVARKIARLWYGSTLQEGRKRRIFPERPA